MEALIDEAQKRNLTIHRIIGTVGGSTYCDLEELKARAEMANEREIEAVMTIGHRKGWNPGAKESTTTEDTMQGFRLRRCDNLCYFIADMM
jgi:hypothetical protein